MLDFLKLKKSIQDVGAQANKLRSEIEEKKQRRDYLETAPLSRKELSEKICLMVAKQGANYPKKLAMALTGLQYKPHFDYEDSHLELVTTTGASSHAGLVPKSNLYWFFADQIKQRLCDAIDVMQWPDAEVGPPLAERQAEIAKLDKEIDKLENQLKELRADAERAGIHIGRADPEPVRPGLFNGGSPLGNVDRQKQ